MTTETHEADPASSQPHASLSDAPALDSSDAQPTQAATPSAADSATADTAKRPNVDDHTTAEHSAAAAPPQKRMRIGSQRPGSPKVAAKPQFLSPAFIDSNIPAKTAPVPNIREKLSDEDEAELAEALEGMSLEEAVAPPAGALAALEAGDQPTARVVAVHRDSVFVDLGGGRQGAVPLRQFREPPSVGALFEVVIQSFDADEGLFHATLPGGAVDVGDWSELAEGMIVEAMVTGMNKGGLECKVNNLRGFMPASQASDYRIEDLTQFLNQKLTCVVTECNPEKRNLVLSHRAVLERQKAESKEKLKAELAEGQVREGVVRSLQDFGAFVDLGGLDGLLHVSQLSWQRVSHPRELLEVGQRVKVLVRKIDPVSGKIGLSLRDLMDNPWGTVESRFAPTSIVTGKVVKVMDFGAFVELEPGIEGLVHISELSHSRVWRASDVVKPGDHVEVKVLSIDREKQRIALSIKAAQAAMPVKSEQPAEEAEAAEEEAPAPIARPNVKLRGGIGRKSKGNQFGLKW